MRRWRLVVVAACIVAGCLSLVSSAVASDASVRSAIKQSAQQVKESGELKDALKELREDPKSLEKVHKAIAKFTGALRKVADTVSAQEGSTPEGKQGKTDYVGGLHKFITGFNDVDKAITDAKNHEKAAAKAELKKGATLVAAGVVEIKKGAQLLHVKSA